MTPTPAGLHSVERTYGKDWAIVFRGTLTECYAEIKRACWRRRASKLAYRVIDSAGKVVPSNCEAAAREVGVPSLFDVAEVPETELCEMEA